MILGVVGLIGAGKGEAAEILARKGFTILDMGDIIREEMKKAHLDITHKTDSVFPVEFRKKHGNDIIAKLIMKKAEKLENKNIVITGLRNTYELDYFKKVVPDMMLIAIEAPATVRFERLKVRGRPEDPKTKEQFDARTERESKGNMGDEAQRKAGLNAVIERADYVIQNAGTKQDLEAEVERVLVRIRRRHHGN